MRRPRRTSSSQRSRSRTSASYSSTRRRLRTAPDRVPSVCDRQSTHAAADAEPGIALIGAGNYAARTLIPAFVASRVRLQGIASGGGVSAAHCARKFGFARATTDSDSLINAEDIDIVVIATRHDSHARFVLRALQAGKHVFVEKPLALTAHEVDSIADAWSACAPAGQRRKSWSDTIAARPAGRAHEIPPRGRSGSEVLVVTVNAPALPASHWMQESARGRRPNHWRMLPLCDLLRFLLGARSWTLGRRRLPVKAAPLLRTRSRSHSALRMAPGHDPLPRKRPCILPEGAHRGVLRGPHPATR